MGPIFEAIVGNEKEYHREDIKEQEQTIILQVKSVAKWVSAAHEMHSPTM